MGLQFEVVVTDVDETVRQHESPAAYVERLAAAEAQAAFQPGTVVIGADTTVTIDHEILGKLFVYEYTVATSLLRPPWLRNSHK